MRKCTHHSAVRFDIEFTTLDVKRRTGGELRSLRGCYISGSNHDEFSNGTVTVVSPDYAHPVSVHLRLIHKLNGTWVK